MSSSVRAVSNLGGQKSGRKSFGIAQPAHRAEESVKKEETETACCPVACARSEENSSSRVNWNYVWLSLAAAALLTVALGLYVYQAGIWQVRSTAEVQMRPADNTGQIESLKQQLSKAARHGEDLKSELAERQQRITLLQKRIMAQTSALDDATRTQADMTRLLQDAVHQKEQLRQQQASTSENLAVAQASLATLQSEIDSARRRQGEGEVRVANLEFRIGDLEAALTASQQANVREQSLRTEDADIRDLMGARDLYIAEIYDVGRDGATQKPFGRIFYTNGKSLVFYAYDLDQQPGAKGATTFQAWGQSDSDRGQALNLGVFYQDSVAKKRWVLKFDDAHALEQIHAVFVTSEPSGGSHAPSGRPLLFASLKIESNHP